MRKYSRANFFHFLKLKKKELKCIEQGCLKHDQNLSLVVQAYNPCTEQLGKEDHRFKPCLGYRASSRPDRAIGETLFQIKGDGKKED